MRYSTPRYSTPRSFPTRILRDRAGTSAVEFAIVAPVFLGLLLAILQITTTFFAQQALETATEKAVRQLMTGQVQQSGMSQGQFKALVCSKLPMFMTCSKLVVDVRRARSFAGASTAAPTLTLDSSGNPTSAGTYSPAAAGEITVARVLYVWNVNKGPLGFDLSTMSGGVRILNATSVFRTESYA